MMHLCNKSREFLTNGKRDFLHRHILKKLVTGFPWLSVEHTLNERLIHTILMLIWKRKTSVLSVLYLPRKKELFYHQTLACPSLVLLRLSNEAALKWGLRAHNAPLCADMCHILLQKQNLSRRFVQLANCWQKHDQNDKPCAMAYNREYLGCLPIRNRLIVIKIFD